jgi:hypothetical protein
VHANVISVNVDTSVDPERKGLHEVVIPRIRQLPGFVAGYWLEPADGKGLSITVFDNEDAARGALKAMGIEPGASPAPGVTIETIDSRMVIGNA